MFLNHLGNLSGQQGRVKPGNLLGTLLIARSGLSTRIARTALRYSPWLYNSSNVLQKRNTTMKDGMKSALQRESHSSENSRTLPGYLGEVFSVVLGLLKARLCVILQHPCRRE